MFVLACSIILENPRAFFTDREFLFLFRRKELIAIIWKQNIALNEDELINQAVFQSVVLEF